MVATATATLLKEQAITEKQQTDTILIIATRKFINRHIETLLCADMMKVIIVTTTKTMIMMITMITPIIIKTNTIIIEIVMMIIALMIMIMIGK